MPPAQLKPRVLLVDDSLLVLEILRAALTERGVEVITASTLDELDRRRKESPPDVIALDVQMPEAWGDDIGALLRASYGETAPMVLVSTLDEDELERRATEAGLDAWISKQKGVERVADKILSLLGATTVRP